MLPRVVPTESGAPPTISKAISKTLRSPDARLRPEFRVAKPRRSAAMAAFSRLDGRRGRLASVASGHLVSSRIRVRLGPKFLRCLQVALSSSPRAWITPLQFQDHNALSPRRNGRFRHSADIPKEQYPARRSGITRLHWQPVTNELGGRRSSAARTRRTWTGTHRCRR